MSMTSAVANLFRRKPAEVERARAPVPFHWDQFIGIGGTNSPSHDALMRETLGVPAIASRVIKDRVASLEPLVFVQRKERNGTVIEEQLDDHPLKALLDNPSRTHTRMQTFGLIAQHVVSVGEAYLLKVGRSMIPESLYVMLPNKVEPLASAGVITGYRVTDGQGREQNFEAREIVRIWNPDPETLYTSRGVLGPQAIVYDALKFQESHLRSHFESNAVPPVVFEGDANAQAPDQTMRELIDTRWRDSYHQTKGLKRGLPGWVPPGWTAKMIDTFGATTGATELLQFHQNQLMMAYGVPRSIVGDVVDANRAAAETNQYVFDLHTVKPIADLIADCMTAQLAADYPQQDGVRLVVRFEQFVSSDKTYELAREAQDLNLKVRSINMVREDSGEDPVEWGDLPVGNFVDAPYTGDLVSDLQDTIYNQSTPINESDFSSKTSNDSKKSDENKSDPNDDDSPRLRVRRPVRLGLTPTAVWHAEEARQRKWVPQFTSRMQRIFAQQRDYALDALRKGESRAHDRINVSLHDIFDPVQWAPVFERLIEPLRQRVVQDAGGSTSDAIGIKPFQFTPAVRAHLASDGVWFRDLVNGTTGRNLGSILDDMYATGGSVQDAATEIRHEFSLRRKQAVMIARTEAKKASQFAQRESYKQSGVVQRHMWNTSLDAAVRDSHMIDGQIAPIDGVFVLNDGITARHPGDPSLPARDLINCRCFITPVLE